MANDKKFIVKNGLQTPNVSFKDSNESLNEITVEMLGTDTLSFSGDVGQLLSLTDTLSETIFSVNDASGNPSIEVDADGKVRIAEVSGNLSIGTDSSRGFNVYVDGTFRADSADIAIVNGNVTGNADTATALASPQNFSLTGDVTATAVSFDGTGAVQLTTAYNPGSIVNADISTSAAIADTKLDTISTIGKVSNSATTATSANTGSAIVARDASGDFSAGTITATLSGNATTATTATNANNVAITDDTSTNSTHYIHFGDATSGYDGVKVSSSKLTFNPSSGALEVNGLSVATTADLTAATSPSFSVDSANFGTANSFTIGEGKAVYYDTGTSKWEGAYNDSTGDYTASHVIVDMTSTDVKIASTGIFTLSGGLSANNYYFLSSTAGTATNDPDSAPTAWQPLYYALNANQIDLQIQTPEDTVITTFGSDGTIQEQGGGINDVVEDTTPQLGGNLDLNSNDITGTGNIDITGNITLDSDLIFTNRVSTDGHIKLYDGDAAGGFAIGIESGTLYNRAFQNHRWYLNSYADGGTSDYMELTTTGLDVPSGTIQDTTGNVRTPRFTAHTGGNLTVADEGVIRIASSATLTTLTLGSVVGGTIICVYNNKSSSITLACGTTVTSMRKGDDNNTTHNATLTLGTRSLTTITLVASNVAIVTGTDVT